MSTNYQTPSSILLNDGNHKYGNEVRIVNIWGLYWRSFVVNAIISIAIMMAISFFIDVRSPDYVKFIPTIWGAPVALFVLFLTYSMHNGPFYALKGHKLLISDACWKLFGCLYSIGLLLVALANYVIAQYFDDHTWVTFKALVHGPLNIMLPVILAIVSLKMAKKF